jgi:ADP-ribose pyrophosphatase YjhB (NUDIX family)
MKRILILIGLLAFGCISMLNAVPGVSVTPSRVTSHTAPSMERAELTESGLREEAGVLVSPTSERTFVRFDFPSEMSSSGHHVFEVVMILRPVLTRSHAETRNLSWIAYPVFDERELSMPITEEAANLSQTGFYNYEDGTVFFEVHTMFDYSITHRRPITGIAFAPLTADTPALNISSSSGRGEAGEASVLSLEMTAVILDR